jgi:hypothetical protein
MVNFPVELRFNDLCLVVSQHDIAAVEIIEDVETSHIETEEAAAGVMGWIKLSEHQWPVFSLDNQLRPLPYLPKERNFCVLLDAGADTLFGLTCEFFGALSVKTRLVEHPVPSAMKLSDSVVESLLIYGESIACTSSGAHLMGYLSTLAEAHLESA